MQEDAETLRELIELHASLIELWLAASELPRDDGQTERLNELRRWARAVASRIVDGGR